MTHAQEPLDLWAAKKEGLESQPNLKTKPLEG